MKNPELLERLRAGNERFLSAREARGDVSPAARLRLSEQGQAPYAIVICCSDSRVIPEAIFSAGLGELFVIRVAGNVLDKHQLGSIEYAAGHLHCRLILMLGHTRCGAVGAALHGGGDGFIQYITDEILAAIGEERDPYRAACRNVEHGVEVIWREFADHPEIDSSGIDVLGAIYDLADGRVEWL